MLGFYTASMANGDCMSVAPTQISPQFAVGDFAALTSGPPIINIHAWMKRQAAEQNKKKNIWFVVIKRT